MLISDSRRAVFVHVQKTGGVSVHALLSDLWEDSRRLPGRRHQTWSQIVEREPALADYFAFGFVRNPWSRMVSWWEMTQWFKRRASRGEPEAVRHLATNPFLAAVVRDYDTFADFLGRGPEDHARLRRPQVDYLTSPKGRVDFVGRTEHLADDMARLVDSLGLPRGTTVPHRNRTRLQAHWRTYYDDRTRERVGEVFAQDLAEFGYTFDG